MKKTEEKKKSNAILRAVCKTAKVGALLFAGTFTVYMFNLENKLIYRVIRPILTEHYDNQVRDRKI